MNQNVGKNLFKIERERERKKEKKKPWRDGNSKLTVDKKRHNKWNVSFQQELGWLLIYIHIFLLLLLLLLVPVCLLIKDVWINKQLSNNILIYSRAGEYPVIRGCTIRLKRRRNCPDRRTLSPASSEMPHSTTSWSFDSFVFGHHLRCRKQFGNPFLANLIINEAK